MSANPKTSPVVDPGSPHPPDRQPLQDPASAVAPQDEPRQRQPDTALARRMLDWEPAIALDAGLKRTIEYFAGIARDA
jgi:nucleoside-diphosphate-sugar epimerase